MQSAHLVELKPFRKTGQTSASKDLQNSCNSQPSPWNTNIWLLSSPWLHSPINTLGRLTSHKIVTLEFPNSDKPGDFSSRHTIRLCLPVVWHLYGFYSNSNRESWESIQSWIHEFTNYYRDRESWSWVRLSRLSRPYQSWIVGIWFGEVNSDNPADLHNTVELAAFCQADACNDKYLQCAACLLAHFLRTHATGTTTW